MNSGKTILIFACLFFLTGPVSAQAPAENPPSVVDELQELERKSAENSSEELKEAGKKGNEELRASGILEKALNVGGVMPAFTLKDAYGRPVTSADLLKKGHIIVVFYRGAWCPYCNLYLRGLQRNLSDFRERGGELVAISVEPPDRSLKVLENNDLAYTVLSDPELKVARAFGIVYTLPKVVNDAVLGLGFDIAKYNGKEKAELPLGATYVVSKEGRIEYAFLETDYKKRADPKEIIVTLDRINSGK